MKTDTRTRWMVSVLTLLTSVTPMQELVAEDTVGRAEQAVRLSVQPAIRDVELLAGGELAGQVVDGTGQPQAGQSIVVQQSGGEPIRTRTDQVGRFRLNGVHAGLCRIEYGEDLLACRCWRANTAPPAATDQLLLVTGESVERGQRCIGDLFCGPVLIGLIIAAAVVIPIAVHNSQNDAS